MQLSIPYALLGPDGTRIVTGNSDTAKADLEYVGPLDPEQGIVGLDGADVRTSVGDVVGGHGGIHYGNFHGRRPVQIVGRISTEIPTEQWPVIEERLQRATNATHPTAPAVLSWQNTGGFPSRFLLLLRMQPPRITGLRPKTFQLALESADYRILGSVEEASAVLAFGVSDELENIGSELATPRFVINGPAGAPGNPIRIRNLTSGLEIRFKDDFAVAGGEVLEVETKQLGVPYPSVKLDGVDRYDAISYLETSWWGLTHTEPNDVQVDGAGAGNAQVFWRPAWV